AVSRGGRDRAPRKCATHQATAHHDEDVLRSSPLIEAPPPAGGSRGPSSSTPASLVGLARPAGRRSARVGAFGLRRGCMRQETPPRLRRGKNSVGGPVVRNAPS